MRTFKYSAGLEASSGFDIGDTIVVSISVMNLDYARWVTGISKNGRNVLFDIFPAPLHGFRVKELKPKPNKIEI